MTEKKNGEKCICCMVAGIVLLLVGLLADYIGIGGGIGFGIKQIIVIVLGVVLFIAGTKPCKFDKFCKLGKGEKKS